MSFITSLDVAYHIYHITGVVYHFLCKRKDFQINAYSEAPITPTATSIAPYLQEATRAPTIDLKTPLTSASPPSHTVDLKTQFFH